MHDDDLNFISPNNRRDGMPVDPLLSPNEDSSSWNELCLIKLLAKGVPWETLIKPVSVKAIGTSPHTNGKAVLLKKIPI